MAAETAIMIIPDSSIELLDWQLHRLSEFFNDFHIYIGLYPEICLDAYKNLIGRYAEKIKISVVELPAGRLFVWMKRMLSSVKERYVVNLEVDHQLFREGVIKSAEFLASNPDYRVVHGVTIVYNSKGHVFSPSTNLYRMACLCNESPYQRFKAYTNSMFLTYLSVRRTKEFIDDLHVVEQYEDTNFDELLVNAVTVIRGKIKRLSALFFLRPWPRPNFYNIPGPIEWVTSSNWRKACLAYMRIVTEELVGHDVASEQAATITNYAIMKYLSRRLNPMRGFRKKISRVVLCPWKVTTLLLLFKNKSCIGELKV